MEDRAKGADGTLRRGWTTGACATAAAKAAYAALLHGSFPDPVTIVLRLPLRWPITRSRMARPKRVWSRMPATIRT